LENGETEPLPYKLLNAIKSLDNGEGVPMSEHHKEGLRRRRAERKSEQLNESV
jgi:hypothetical protein